MASSEAVTGWRQTKQAVSWLRKQARVGVVFKGERVLDVVGKFVGRLVGPEEASLRGMPSYGSGYVPLVLSDVDRVGVDWLLLASSWRRRARRVARDSQTRPLAIGEIGV
jgi:hypothetical protein